MDSLAAHPEIGDDAGSSSSLSPPASSPHNDDRARVVLPTPPSYPRLSNADGVVRPATASASPAHVANSADGFATVAPHADDTTGRPRRPRKKRELGPDGRPVADASVKEKKTRKSRESKQATKDAKDQREKPAATAAAAVVRKRKSEPVKPELKHDAAGDDDNAAAAATATAAAPPASQVTAPVVLRQTTLTGTLSSPQQTVSSSNQFMRTILSPQTLGGAADAPATAPSPASASAPAPAPAPAPASAPGPAPAPRPHSSGQNYDPIRGSTVDPSPRLSVQPPAAAFAATSAPTPARTSPQTNHPSTSPAIASLVDNPYTPATAAPHMLQSNQRDSISHPLQSPPSPRPKSGAPAASLQRPPSPQRNHSTSDPMEVDAPVCDVAMKPTPEIRVPSKASSNAGPANKRQHNDSALKGTGSGLLSSADLFGLPSTAEATERKGVNIEIRIPLDRSGGNTITIAQEIVRKYGRDAVNPRAAAHRELLLRVAARANALEGGSADDTSVDLLSDADDSNVEMVNGGGGLDDEQRSAADANTTKPTRKRKRPEDYDKDDDFIDDTELAWQQQAAVAKDGFFVYSGPLVPEGQTPQVESSTGASTRGTRGRGRGRGRGAGAGAAAGTTHASLAERKTAAAAAAAAGATGGDSTANGSSPTPRARGRGRGTGATRKPRITKAERERVAAEALAKQQQQQQQQQHQASTASPSMVTGSTYVNHITSSAAAAATHLNSSSSSSSSAIPMPPRAIAHGHHPQTALSNML